MDIKTAVREAIIENGYSPDGLPELVEEKLKADNSTSPKLQCSVGGCCAVAEWHLCPTHLKSLSATSGE